MEAVQKFDAKIISAKAILLDIEGTTTSKSFVKDTLFPYASDNVSSFLTSNWEVAEVKAAVTALRELASKEKSDGVEGCVEILGETEDNRDSVIKSVVDNVKWQISLDRKTSALKSLQGLIWEKGYKDGTIKGHVYDDVPEVLASWVKSGHRLYVYSSGSVAAQKLLFGHTEKGSLLDNFAGYFDTSVGSKQEVESYKTISKEIGSDRILFLTDIVKEAAAAVEAGLSAVLVERDADSGFTDEDRQKYSIITTFADLPLSIAGGKRKSIDNTEDELPPAKVAKTDETTESADSTESLTECTMETETKTEKEKDNVSVSEPIVDETEKPVESNDVEAMEVDSISTNINEEVPIKTVVNKTPECDSTDMKSDVVVDEGKAKEIPETAASAKEDIVKTDVEEVTQSKIEEAIESKMEVAETNVEQVSESKIEEVTESKTEKVTESRVEEVIECKMEEVIDSKMVQVTESKIEDVTQSKLEEVTESKIEEVKLAEDKTAQVPVKSKTDVGETKIHENGKTENKTENEENNIEENGTKIEVKVSNEETKTSKTDETEVTTTDAKPADQADHALKESNGIETNGSNGSTVEDELIEPKKAEENGVSSDVVESSTNGADSDKENDKEEEKKAEAVTNGGVTEEVCDVKIKKIQTDSCPVPAQVEETSA